MEIRKQKAQSHPNPKSSTLMACYEIPQESTFNYDVVSYIVQYFTRNDNVG